MLTGSVPFTGDTPVEIAMKHLSTVPELPSAKRPDVPQDLDLVVLRALAKDPDDRFQTAEEMDAELGRVAAGLGVTDATADAATAVLAGAGRVGRGPDRGRPPAPAAAVRRRTATTTTRSRRRRGAGRSGPGCSRPAS